MPGELVLLLLIVWTGAIAWINYFTLPDKYLWVPMLLALVGVFGSLLPLAVTSNIALVANAVTLALFIGSLERLTPRHRRAFAFGSQRPSMKFAFEHAELSDGTGERSAEHRRDEDGWSRMDDEGCPNEGSQPMAARQNRHERSCLPTLGSLDVMEHPVRTLLYDVFVGPISRFLHWPVTKHVEGHPDTGNGTTRR